MGTLQKALTWLIPIIFLILAGLWLIGPDGVLRNATEGPDGIKQQVSIADIFKSNKEASQISEASKKATNRLINGVKTLQKSQGENCFYNYGGLDLLDEWTTLEFRKESKGTRIIIYGGESGNEEIATEVLEGVSPCVVGGEPRDDQKPAAKNFHSKFLAQGEYDSRSDGPYYTIVDSVQIRSDESITDAIARRANNDPRSEDAYNEITYNGEGFEFEDGGYLFKGVEGDICFFPTRGGDGICDGDEDGLEDVCLGKSDARDLKSIPNLVSQGKLDRCSASQEQHLYTWVEFAAPVDRGPNRLPIRTKCEQGTICHSHKNECDEFVPDGIKAGGCHIIASDQEAINDCAVAKAKPFSVLPTSDELRFFYSEDVLLGTIRGDEDGKKLLLEGFQWETQGDEPLLCNSNGFWYGCTQASLGTNFIHDPSTASTVECVKEGDKYIWKFSHLADSDEDGIDDSRDNCVSHKNPGQYDFDGDTVGNICDLCPFEKSYEPNENQDQDVIVQRSKLYEGCLNPDTLAEAKEVDKDLGGRFDSDDDELIDEYDNCPHEYNPSQYDQDEDQVGDQCDLCPQVKGEIGENGCPIEHNEV